MKKGEKNSANRAVRLASATVMLIFICAGGFLIGFLIEVLTGDEGGERPKREVLKVELVNPPPLPPTKAEKKPQPPVKVKETFRADRFEAPKMDAPPQKDAADKPRGRDLGLDAKGAPGTDVFGLKGIQGGSGIIGGGGSGGSSPMGQFAWYVRIIQDEIREAVNKRFNQTGSFPKGKLETVVKIVLDERGSIGRFEIMNSSGDHNMDDAVKSTVKGMTISRRPPDGMPRVLSVKVATP
jgi:protein TonB